jgi:hypothetical protein
MRLDDSHIASVFALGLLHGFLEREHMIRWADHEILARAGPPAWILDLATSAPAHVLDVISLLNERGHGVDPEQRVRIAYALLPESARSDFDACKLLAAEMYRVAMSTLGTWMNQLVCHVGVLDENFDLFPTYCIRTEGQLIEDVREAVRGYGDPAVRERLGPVRWIVGRVRLEP